MRQERLYFDNYQPQFKIKRGYAGEHFAVFETASDAEMMEWLFPNNSIHCFGAYDNAYKLS